MNKLFSMLEDNICNGKKKNWSRVRGVWRGGVGEVCCKVIVGFRRVRFELRLKEVRGRSYMDGWGEWEG